MDKIRVDTDLLTECGFAIGNSGKDALNLSDEIQSVLAAMPECCQEKYSRVVQSYEKEVRSISNDLNRLRDGVNKAVQRFLECERSIREQSVFEEAPDARSGEGSSGNANKWSSWPWTWIDAALDWLGIDKYGRDYVDPGSEAQADKDEAIRNEISVLFQSDRYSRERWNSASTEERKRILNDLLKDLNAVYGTKITKEIHFFKEEADSRGVITLGYYSDKRREVSINTEILTSENYEDVMNTMVHEMRHAYQHEAVRNPSDFIVSEETAKSWESNFDDYIEYTEEENNFDEYRYQPVEADAHDIADYVEYDTGIERRFL